MQVRDPVATRRILWLPHADVWAVGIIFFLSRVQWIVELRYHSDQRAPASLFVVLCATLFLIIAGHVLARFLSDRTFAILARAMVLATFLYFVATLLRPLFDTEDGIASTWKVVIGVGAIILAGFVAVRVAAVWPRLRAALLAMVLTASISPFVLAALLAPRIELFADSHDRRRPVVVLLLDEFSAGSAQELAHALAARRLQVDSWAVPHIGRNTLDAIPGIFSGSLLKDARICTGSAICNNTGVVDFARMLVKRDDVDVVGIYHPYCAIEGLRHCVDLQRAPGQSATLSFLCGSPLHFLIGRSLGCNRARDDLPADEDAAAVNQKLFAAPFWKRGGLLFAHLMIPHPPSASGEPRLEDAYRANLERASKLVLSVVDQLERGALRDDFTLVITSDHHLRSELWCRTEPYASNDCNLPQSMVSPEVPFIIATRGASVAHGVPRSNADLLAVVTRLSAAR